MGSPFSGFCRPRRRWRRTGASSCWVPPSRFRRSRRPFFPKVAAATAVISSTVRAVAIEAARATAARRGERSARMPGGPSPPLAVQNQVASTDRSGDRVPTEPPRAGPLAALTGVLPQAPTADPNGDPVPKPNSGLGLPGAPRAVLPLLAAIAGPNGGRARRKLARPGLSGAEEAGRQPRGSSGDLRRVVPARPPASVAPAGVGNPRPLAPPSRRRQLVRRSPALNPERCIGISCSRAWHPSNGLLLNASPLEAYPPFAERSPRSGNAPVPKAGPR